jgi:hypothetical protein
VKVYLRVPFGEHRQAKAAGAHWEASSKQWYVVDRVSYRRCKPWHLPETPEVHAWAADKQTEEFYRKTLEQFYGKTKAADPPPVSQRLLKTA